MTCHLGYIPKRLHTDEKPILSNFSIGEKLFYRCNPNKLQEPYDSISLRDISHNRNFNSDIDYPSDDVLYNISPGAISQKYDSHIVTLIIVNVNNLGTYSKEIDSLDNKVKIEITLLHKPEPCMYPHCAFEIKIDGVIINEGNYDQLLGKGNSTQRNMRKLIRLELTSMLQRNAIDIDGDIEIIDEP